MIMILPFVLFLSIQTELDILKPFFPLSARFHQQCLDWFSPNSETKSDTLDLSRSFICGQKVASVSQKIVLLKSGLYHAIVVSGGHFLFLNMVLKRLLWPHWLRLIALGFYYFITGLQAPGLRYLMHMGLVHFTQKRSHLISDRSLCFYSGLLCLALSSPLWTSLSFWLSFAVSLSLSFSKEVQTRSSTPLKLFLPIILIYIFLFPFNFTSSYLHPLNLLLGMLLLQPFSTMLLVSAVMLLIGRGLNYPWLLELNVWLNQTLFQALEKGTLLMPEKSHQSLSLFYLWLYLFILSAALHVFVVHYRRETIHE